MMTISITHLIDALNTPDYGVRERAKTQLLNLGASAVMPLIEVAQAQSGLKSCVAVSLLGQLEDRRCIEPLMVLLTSQNAMLALAAAEALEAYELTLFLKRLLEILPHSGYLVQIRLVIILGKLHDLKAVPVLMSILRRTDPSASLLRYITIQALGELGDFRAVSLIKQFQNDPDVHVQKYAQVALQKLNDANIMESNDELER